MNTISEVDPVDIAGTVFLSSFFYPPLFLAYILRFCLGNVLRYCLPCDFLLIFGELAVQLAVVLLAEVITEFVDGLYKFVLYGNVCLVAGSSVILERNDAF